MRVFLIMGLTIASLLLQAQEKAKFNLTRYINEIERMHQMKVSYSPSVTDTIYPNISFTILSVKKPADVLLSEILRGTGYGVMRIKGLIYLHREPVLPSPSPPRQIMPVVERDTLRVPPLTPDSIRLQTKQIRMDKIVFNGISVWNNFIPVDRQPDYMKWSIYSNLLLLGTGSVNLGTSFGLSPKWALGGMVSYNPWTYGKTRIKHIMLRPEVRYWLCDNSTGYYLGANLTYVRYNMGGIDLPLLSDNIKKNRYQGSLGGLGVSYGYSWVLGKRISMEIEIGVGINHTKYTKYPCTDYGQKIKTDKKIFVSPNKFAVNLVYVLK